ncbi:MAG TPA: adenosine deaminase [Candidatus Baltobacteraceae bacterium]|nr:adenosine deaminase [Candidatus Baltobacteraceae bacterium]
MPGSSFLRRLPKVQLHCHLEGTLRPDTFIDLARRRGVALTYQAGEGTLPAAEIADAGPEHVYDFRDFQGFLMTFAAVSRSLALPEDYARLAEEFAEDAVGQNVMRAEVFISPSVWRFFHPEIDVRACVVAMRRVFDAVRRDLEVEFIVDVTRNFGAESAMRTARLAADLQDLGVIGIGLGGDEVRFPPESFVEVFDLARKHGLRCVAHAGEASGAHSVLTAIEQLGAERIGHGIRALEDPATMALLAQRRIPLEVCPTSNFLTGVVPRDRSHPLLELDAAGCVVSIDADDPALFRTSVTQEYEYVEQLAGREAVERFARNAVEASFASPQRKTELHGRLDAFGLEPSGARRTS